MMFGTLLHGTEAPKQTEAQAAGVVGVEDKTHLSLNYKYEGLITILGLSKQL